MCIRDRVHNDLIRTISQLPRRNSDYIQEFLMSIPFLRNIRRTSLLIMTHFVEKQVFTKNHVIYREGEMCDFVYFIVNGEVEVSRMISKSETTIQTPITGRLEISLLGPLSVCGDEELVKPSAFRQTSAAVVSMTAEVYSLPFKVYMKIYNDPINFPYPKNVKQEWRNKQRQIYENINEQLRGKDERRVVNSNSRRFELEELCGAGDQHMFTPNRYQSLKDLLSPVVSSPSLPVSPEKKKTKITDKNSLGFFTEKAEKLRERSVVKRKFDIQMDEVLSYIGEDDVKIKDVLHNMKLVMDNYRFVKKSKPNVQPFFLHELPSAKNHSERNIKPLKTSKSQSVVLPRIHK
eukprot:TRINITY_DN12061_c0_g1_i1.p1 TRINITY_DN12061_c0_g1~~TRINITY_DN12061_c0_g1_i1.p1  ORF type:complete len:348 (-),score=47.15 TRINITY_DN12061_c0_g1_i1:85-1128(-)